MLAVHNGWPIADADITTALMHEAEEELIYTLPADGWRKESWCWRLTQNINGRRTGAQAWFSHVTNVLKELGLTATKIDPCMFVRSARST